MSYSRKNVTDSVKSKHKSSMNTENLMNEIDEAYEKYKEDAELEETHEMDESFKEEIFGKKRKKEKEEEIEETPHKAIEEEKAIEKEDTLEVQEEKQEEVSEETESIDTEIMDKIEEEFEEDLRSFKQDRPTKEKVYSTPKQDNSLFLIIVVCISIFFAVYFFTSILMNSASGIYDILVGAILSIFTIVYLIVCVTSTYKKELPIFISAFLLIAFFAVTLFMPDTTSSVSTTKVQNFSGKSLTDVVKWAKKNNIKVTQEYEYSDMVPEFEIISQDVKVGTDIRDVDEIVVAISEGPNPYKEIIVPSMLTWDSERVINYVLNNHLSNVIVNFVDSDQLKDTVIEQSKSGNLRRNEELVLTFSYGEEGSSSEIHLIDFTNKTKFEIEFYMKQNRLNYDFVYDFSDTIKKGYGMGQSIEAGSVVQADGDKVQVTISKGPKITIPDLSGKTVEELTEWAIKNHLKLEFIDQYDENIKKGNVISIDKEKDDVVEQGTLIKVTLSLGNLKMPKFKNADAFYTWADKYGIKYETQHEFNSSVDAGDIIRFSYKTGDTIKNDDTIVVTISDGKKVEVPNLKGLTKSEATKKLKNASLNYNFIYKNNSSKKDTVLSQSISAGSEVSSGTTVTVTLSNGTNSSSNNNNNTSNNNSGNNNSGSTTPSPIPTPTTSCKSCTVLASGIKDVIAQKVKLNAGYSATANAVIAYIEGQCPGIDVQVRAIQDTGLTSGKVVPNMNSWAGGETTSCSTVHIYLAA